MILSCGNIFRFLFRFYRLKQQNVAMQKKAIIASLRIFLFNVFYHRIEFNKLNQKLPPKLLQNHFPKIRRRIKKRKPKSSAIYQNLSHQTICLKQFAFKQTLAKIAF